MAFSVIGCKATGNGGDGFRVEGSDVSISDCESSDNKGHGFNLVSEEQSAALAELGLGGAKVDPTELAELLKRLSRTAEPHREEEAKESRIGQFISSLANGSEILSKVMTIAADPTVHAWIARLLPHSV